ncbi:MAG: benzoate-CoA ligase family protein [Thermincola sp.]|nr:benzoate-CoA ligase family protein [Thermincola sp.]MDT3701441.1 benzoate-CoA ligase family protein [Thermincola sp.]
MDSKADMVIPERLNLATYFLDENIACGRGERVALYYQDQSYTYNQLCELTNKVGNTLKMVGVERENRVLLVLNDCPEWAATWLGTMKIGAVSTCVYTYLHTSDYEYFIDYIKPAAIVVDETTVEKVREALANLHHPSYMKGLLLLTENPLETANREFEFKRMIGEASGELECEPTSRDEIAFWNFSGGTTDKPKGVPHMHRDGLIGCESWLKMTNYNENDVVVNVPKLFFHYAHDLGLNFVLRVGGSIVLYKEKVTPNLIFELISKYRPSVLVNVPTMMLGMLQVPDRERHDISCLRATLSSGEALSGQLYNDWMKGFGVEVVEVLGSAESYMGYLANRPGEKVPGSVGRLTPFVEAKIVDGDGNPVPKGEHGTLWIKADSVGTYYYLDHEKSKKTFIGGDWLNTGDLFREDEEGNFWYIGRAEENIKVSGVWVPILEVQQLLQTHSDIKECVMIGVPDSYGLMTTKAYVVLKQGVDPSDKLSEELKIFCKERLAVHKFPRIVEFLNELPKTGQGKVDKRKLKEMELAKMQAG